MATSNGNYREMNIASIANAIVLINAHLDVEEAALGAAAVKVTGNLSMAVTAGNGAGALFTHRVNISLECLTVADTKTLTAALSVFATAMETESEYTTVLSVDVSMSVSMTS